MSKSDREFGLNWVLAGGRNGTERRALLAGATAFVLTSVHHVYGAVRYQTPWRYHAVALGALALLAMYGGLLLSRRHSTTPLARVAWWTFWIADALVFVLGLGIFEGAYNHVLKLALYFAQLSPASFQALFPSPTYELPNDAFFELSGAAQVIPAAFAARQLLLLALTRRRSRAQSARTRQRVGSMFEPRTLVTLFGDAVNVPSPVERVHLQLRRFAGCPVCDRHLHELARRNAEIEAAGVREVVVFHSTAEELRKYEADLPFSVVPDPNKRLYFELGVESGPRALLDPRAWPTIARAVLRSAGRVASGRGTLPSLNPGGGRLGLPAEFLIERDGSVLAAHYGEHAGDHWSVDELLRLARWAKVTGPETSKTPQASELELRRELGR